MLHSSYLLPLSALRWPSPQSTARSAANSAALRELFAQPADSAALFTSCAPFLHQVGEKVSLCLARTIYKDGTMETGKFDKVRQQQQQ